MMTTTSPVSAAACAIGAVHPLRRTGNALQVGGVFWMAHCVSQSILSLWLSETGQNLGGFLPFVDALLLAIAVWASGSGVIELADFLLRWSPAAALSRSEFSTRLSMWIAGGSAIATLFALLNLLATGDSTGVWGVYSLIGACLAVAVLGAGVWRAESLPRRHARALVIVGAAPFPLILIAACLGSAAVGMMLVSMVLAASGLGLVWLGRELGKL